MSCEKCGQNYYLNKNFDNNFNCVDNCPSGKNKIIS